MFRRSRGNRRLATAMELGLDVAPAAVAGIASTVRLGRQLVSTFGAVEA